MGDRCYMSVQCRVRDAKPFFDLGFYLEERIGNLACLVDSEANFGHSGDMPKGIAYCAESGSGDDYDAQTEYQDSAGESNHRINARSTQGYTFVVDDEGNLNPKDKDDWLEFIRLRNVVEADLETARNEAETEIMPEE
ncbi:MAG: hypothetical protein H2169_06615 [Opitutus sp.]|nr:hypothetical protein [Opitutus sp.]